MKKIYKTGLAFILALLFAMPAFAQYSFQSGDNTIQVSGLAAVYYNNRILKPGNDNYKNNRFTLRNLQFELEARNGKNWETKFKVDFAKIMSNTDPANFDPENPGISNAYVQYSGLPVKFKFGFDKLPYSQGSLNDVFGTPFWSRGILTGGDLFSRRDMGLTLHYPCWQQRINVYGGVYTGMGENMLTMSDSDPSGHYEYVGRIDVAYPTRYRYNEIDLVHVPIPMFRIGANARYTDKTQTAGNTLPLGLGGNYGVRVINGKRLVYGLDASAQYMGFSAQAEFHVINLQPADPSDILFNNTTAAFNGGKVLSGGLLTRVNYNSLLLRSTLSCQFENLNLNNLVPGTEQLLSVAYAYNVKGFDSVLKVQYYHPLKEDQNSDPLKWTDQIRLGYQYQF
ncbi:MAG: hypothetical protein V4543_15915 [Bacteroidota bacterium]